MGIFNTYTIPCPYCNFLIEEQRKPGNMNDYYFGRNPIEDIQFEGFYTCYNCCGTFEVAMETVPKMVIRKIEK